MLVVVVVVGGAVVGDGGIERGRERVNRKSDGCTAERNKSRARKQIHYRHGSGGVVKTQVEIVRYITA